MAEFSSYEPDRVEVVGEVIESFLLGFPEGIRRSGLVALDKYGIRDIVPDRFYEAQPFLSAMKEVAQQLGRNWMTRIGLRIALNVSLPPEWDTLQAAYEGLNKAYHSKYRGGEIGNWSYQHMGLSGGLERGKMISSNHYCCAFDRGVLEGFAERFRPTGINDVLVRHEDSRPCRKTGADSCTYIISWA